MRITFWGAARKVTGSMFLLELESDFRILIDCGMDMDSEGEEMPVYPGSVFPFEASMINVVILTHAHLDHTGKVPNLIREGFEGPIFCTAPTTDLAEILLYDAASINKSKLNKYHKRKGQSPGYKPNFNLEEIFQEKHVKQALSQIKSLAVNKTYKLTKSINLRMISTGHLLGASNVYLEIEENNEKKSILFSGDIGRQNYPLLKDPETPPQADYVICETTYGGKYHQSLIDTEEELLSFIQKSCIENPGKLIIPAFSIGRTQAILYTINKLFREKKLPDIPVFADSPMAMKSNRVYEAFSNHFNEESTTFKKKYGELFYGNNFDYIEQLGESKKISSKPGPCIIVSSSGMLEGGRIQHHIRTNLQNPDTTILMVGFTPEGTFGHKLRNAPGVIEMGKKNVPINAKILNTDAFSGHGDHDDLLRFIHTQKKENTKGIFLVHGEETSMDNFKDALIEEGYQNVVTPSKGESFTL
ncbi:MBL fold metallo-hydrolase RNA specificity domain-containing protein [Chondrinema litorale]|uniref:MBL fold metallo-hydrolase RNA specificity domain-containing protein n=1 Tax=Chondrinema litorale TaxID=2994555 RepID=UPI002543FA89|nr:MBL fold metallo-hydrolase [Chondrinema litorale]UZR94637.1 MBL fold metallo-hydrolase [Chondrinema litorale]